MSPTVLPATRPATGLQGRHVLMGMLAFFGIIFAVNGVLLYQALSTHSGLVAQEPYRKGLAYNARIAADERQASLQWSAEVEVVAEGRVALGLVDAQLQPVAGRTVAAVLGRPTSNRHDLRLSLVERSPGQYVAQVGRIDAGAWLIDVEIRDSADQGSPSYRLRRRIWLKP